MSNVLKTTALLGALTGLMLLLGDVLGGSQGMLLALVFAAITNFGAWFFSDRLVLATSGAVPITDPRLAWLEDDVAELAARAGIPKPRVFVVPHERSPNAFATGRSPAQGVVAVTAGLLQVMDRRQIRGVLAHELGHVAHRDTLTSAVAATLAGAVAFLARFALFSGGRDERDGSAILRIGLALLAPLAAMVLQMAVSRSREFAADARAAALTGDPEGLAAALETLGMASQRVPMHTGNEATHYIVNGFTGSLGRWFSTHPPIEERVRRLRAMGR